MQNKVEKAFLGLDENSLYCYPKILITKHFQLSDLEQGVVLHFWDDGAELNMKPKSADS